MQVNEIDALKSSFVATGFTAQFVFILKYAKGHLWNWIAR